MAKRPKSKGSVERRPLSDANKLLWQHHVTGLQAAVEQINAGIRGAHAALATAMIRAQGLDAEEWLFDLDTVTLVRKARP